MKIIKLLILTTLIFIIPSCSHTHTFELSEVIEPKRVKTKSWT